jgi:hypothetical protein
MQPYPFKRCFLREILISRARVSSEDAGDSTRKGVSEGVCVLVPKQVIIFVYGFNKRMVNV